MAVQDSENPSSPGIRLSPGDAAFERLRQREALRVRDDAISAPELQSPMFIGPPDPAAPMGRPSGNPGLAAESAVAAPADATPPAASASVSSPNPAPAATAPASTSGDVRGRAEDPPDRVLAMAAAFGIETASEPSSPDETPAASDVPALTLDAVDDAPAPALVAPAPPPPREASPPPAAAPVDATAARLEAALLDQLRTLEETLVGDAPHDPHPRLPRAAQLRPAKKHGGAPTPETAPQRSVFAPDPVRQRTYVDLRSPSPVSEAAESGDPPWRKYLAEPQRRETAGRSAPRPRAASPAGRPVRAAPGAVSGKPEVEERGRGLRAMTAAAVLGLGIGLGLIVLIRPFVDAGGSPVATSTPETPAPVVAALPDTESADGTHVNQALATLLADTPVSRASPGEPAVILEPGTMPPAADVVAAAEPAAVTAPPVIRPPPGEAVAVARAPDFDVAESGPLAYGPTIPSYDPVRQQLLATEEEAAEPAARPRAATAARAPVREQSAPVRSGRAVINDFVNLRSKPDNAAPVVAILAEGLAVKVIGCDYWCEIEAGGKRGFVYKKFVSR